MTNETIIQQIQTIIKDRFSNEASGHDWWHIFRVHQLSKKISETEGGNLFIIELAALLHDIADWKFNNDEKAGSREARKLQSELCVDKSVIKDVCQIIDEISFKGAGVSTPMSSIEGQIVQDADRLDAIGAIGIARTFAYGGHKGRIMYNPEIKPELHQTFNDYKKSSAPTINHFYEKLLLLKDRMNTPTGKQIAEKRHKFMEEYLDEFYAEWNNLI